MTDDEIYQGLIEVGFVPYEIQPGSPEFWRVVDQLILAGSKDK